MNQPAARRSAPVPACAPALLCSSSSAPLSAHNIQAVLRMNAASNVASGSVIAKSHHTATHTATRVPRVAFL